MTKFGVQLMAAAQEALVLELKSKIEGLEINLSELHQTIDYCCDERVKANARIKELVDVLKEVVDWAESLKMYADANTQMVPVFQRAKEVLSKA